MKTLMLSALAVGLFGSGASAQSAMQECCPTRTADCCSTRPDNCCVKPMKGCCEKMNDECCTFSVGTDGKRTIRKTHCVQPEKAAQGGKTRVEVKPEDRRPGDDWGYKTLGKILVKTYYRDVDVRPGTPADSDCSGTKNDCDYGYFSEGKHSVRKSFCAHDGQRVLCGENAGQCGTCMK